MDKKISYRAKGYVHGYYWGGGEGAYSANTITADTREELDQKINDAIKDGSLDAGMGYERLIGAVMIVDTVTDIEIDGKIFSNVESDLIFYGDLSEKQQDFLLSVVHNN